MIETTSGIGEQAGVVQIGDRPLSIEDVVSLARGAAKPVLAASVKSRMEASRATLRRLHGGAEPIYGVTSSVGASVDVYVPPESSDELSLNLLRMHGCGTGQLLRDEQAAAVMAVRIVSLAAGCSGVRPVIAERLVTLLRHRVLPRIPSEGSVGASGDLTPLSYLAAALVGEREVSFEGRVLPAKEALQAIGKEPLRLESKEALSLMNGTSVATALSCLAWSAACRLARIAAGLTAMSARAILGNPLQYDAFVHAAKPHAGQQRAAAWIAEDFGATAESRCERLQDRYSIRCAPHVIGVLVDALSWGRNLLETELNGVSDNPLVDVERGRVLHGGNFYGGHVAFICDALKTAVANVACLLDRQLMLLCNPAENAGLPADLKGATGPAACTHNGFKAVTIATSALTAEALKLTVPASSFSRSTELHNQDKVPMATIAARDLLRVIQLSEQVAAMLTLANCQAMDLRGGYVGAPRAAGLLRAVRGCVPRLEGDRRMDTDIAAVLDLIRNDALPCGSADI